jgi:preprotein translocase subunit SecY
MASPRDGKFATLQVKLLWTGLFFVCFMAGRNIPINLLHDAPGTRGTSGGLLNIANVATGGNFFSPSFFSLGLGPWMGAAILWRFLFIGKFARDRKIPQETVTRARYGVMLALAVVQAISLMSTYEVHPLSWGPITGRHSAEVLIVIVLTAGAALVAWLATQNEDKGLGGITMFIFYQLIITATRNRGVFNHAIHESAYRDVLWLVLAACVCVVILGVFAGNAELRIHVNKVSIDSGYTGVSYLPIKLNPAGASPIMYALALLAIPQYVAHALAAVIPATSSGVGHFLSVWGLNKPVGFAIYLVLLFAMTIFFGLITVDPKDIAKRMRDSGQYFDHVPPGEATRRYVRRRVVALSAVTGVLLVVLTGIPLHFIVTYPKIQYILTLPQTLMILLALMWLLQEEIADTMIGTRYAFSFRTTPRRAAA